MSISSTVYSRLNDSSITATVPASRIYPTEPERGTDWPFIVYRTTATSPVTSMAGTSGVTNYAVQVDVWAKSLSSADSIANAVAARLHCYRGGNVVGAFLIEQSNEQLADETEGDIYHTVQSYSVWAA